MFFTFQRELILPLLDKGKNPVISIPDSKAIQIHGIVSETVHGKITSQKERVDSGICMESHADLTDFEDELTVLEQKRRRTGQKNETTRDFNDIASPIEKRGIHPHPTSLMDGFNLALEECGLFDLGMRGRKFTWERGKGSEHWVEERLDRAVAAAEWCTLFPLATVYNHDPETLTHLMCGCVCVAPLWLATLNEPPPEVEADGVGWLINTLVHGEELRKLRVVATWWNIWRSRNEIVWNNKNWNMLSTAHEVQRCVDAWQCLKTSALNNAEPAQIVQPIAATRQEDLISADISPIYQMAPKSRISKRQRGETSQQAQNPHQVQQFETFNTPQARERYDTWVSTRDFKKERGIQLEVPEEWNWKPLLLAQPCDACCSVVKEFYANVGDGMNTNTAIVRGVEVDFSSDAINTYYGTEDYYEDDYYHNDLKMSNLTVEMLNEIAKTFDAEAEWNIRSGLIAHMDYKYFTPRDRAIIDFIKAKLIPNSHRGYVRRDQVLLTYCIKEGYTIDVGVLINQSIREIITMMVEKKSRSILGHPYLITELCKNAWAQRPGDADQQEEDVAMGDPNRMPAQLQIPQQFDMQQFFARQEEFRRRQDNFMRRNDEINWYVGTSTYQHNQAAQGFTPHFPPPPPWLQDPQYIPDYYRPHFPPPPDDDDHQ
nr:uncharacterized protein LOC109169324 [Ipomoea batatas]